MSDWDAGALPAHPCWGSGAWSSPCVCPDGCWRLLQALPCLGAACGHPCSHGKCVILSLESTGYLFCEQKSEVT